jgi:SAM-dependent methyltransferase
VALLWADDRTGKRLEVRSAGRTRRLYADGVLHTQYNPALPLTGSVWDHLLLAALFAPAGAIQRVLLLGLGGGAAVQLLQRYLKPQQITAVELDRTRIALARKFFGVGGRGTKLVAADARDWVGAYEGPPFQLVIDDLFAEEQGEATRAFPFDARWCRNLLRLLDNPGWLAVNFAPRSALDAAVLVRERRYRRRFPAAFCFVDPQLDNAVAAFCGTRSSSQGLRRRLAAHHTLGTTRAKKLMHFRIETLWR